MAVRRASILIQAALLVLPCSPSLACTLCHTELAERVRAGVFGDGFWQSFGASSLPFLAILAIAAVIHGRGARV
jgi:hypothetical protein